MEAPGSIINLISVRHIMLKNAIVVMFDSLQFNYLGCYGNDWIRTPNFDRFAREGVLFENAYAEGLPTVPVRRAMHTGRFTLPTAGWVGLSNEDTTIADLCWGRPVDTALVFDCPMYRLPKFGYTRGFDKVWFTHGHEADDYFYECDPLLHYDPMDYIDQDSYDGYVAATSQKAADYTLHEVTNYLRQRQFWRGEKDRYCTRTFNKAIQYLEECDKHKQFFLWVDSFDPHEPWDPPSVYKIDADGNYDPNMKCPYDPDYKGKDVFLPFSSVVDGVFTEEQLHHVRMLYAELITLCDKNFGRLMDTVRRLGLEENTMVLVVSDHGEPMGNGEHGHGIMRKTRPWPYEELAHIVFMMRAPGLPQGKRVSAFVQSTDVAPTVLEWLGIGAHPDMQGHDLMPLAKGEVDKVYDFAIAGYHGYSWALYNEDWTFIHWVKKEGENRMGKDFYAASVDSSHLRAVGGKGMFDGIVKAYADLEAKEKAAREEGKISGSSAREQYKDAATLDGEAQWTCTPGSVASVPENDELYDRHNDPFQLRNLTKEKSEVAKDLLFKLRYRISELKAL